MRAKSIRNELARLLLIFLQSILNSLSEQLEEYLPLREPHTNLLSTGIPQTPRYGAPLFAHMNHPPWFRALLERLPIHDSGDKQ